MPTKVLIYQVDGDIEAVYQADTPKEIAAAKKNIFERLADDSYDSAIALAVRLVFEHGDDNDFTELEEILLDSGSLSVEVYDVETP